LGIASLGQHFLKRQKKRREEEVEGGTKEGKTSRKREDKGRAGQYVQAGSELEKSQIRGVRAGKNELEARNNTHKIASKRVGDKKHIVEEPCCEPDNMPRLTAGREMKRR